MIQVALDLVVIHEELPVRVWYVEPRAKVWLIKPCGTMKLFPVEEVLALPVAPAALAAGAFAATK